jgi:hypothetical protein
MLKLLDWALPLRSTSSNWGLWDKSPNTGMLACLGKKQQTGYKMIQNEA